nr:immunoglobulin light chain junction region [Macaca mulatta]
DYHCSAWDSSLSVVLF